MHLWRREPAACRLCPVCQLISFVQRVSPETLERVADVVELAATGLRDLAPRASGSRPERGRRHRRTRRPTEDDDPEESPNLAIGIDIGGTKVAAGVVDEHGTITHRTRRETPDRSTSPAIVEETIAACVEELVDRLYPADVVAVGVGAAGFVSEDRGTVLFAPHLSWRMEPLRSRLADGFPGP